MCHHIQFRCWYCNKKYAVNSQRIGESITCTCDSPLCVPRCSGGRCRVKTPVDFLVEIVVYGLGGAFLGFGLAVLILSRAWFWNRGSGLTFVVTLTIVGFLAVLFGGERGMNWIGQMIQDREER